MSWPTFALSEVTEIISGGTPKSGIPEFWEGNVEWITPKDMGKMTSIYASYTSRKITELGLIKSSAKLIPQNSVILSTRAPIGHLAINTVPMATNQGCRGLVPKSDLDTKYLFYFLFNSVELINDLGSGTTFKELSKGALEKVSIPLPLLSEQKRIVALLDTVFTDLEQTRAKTEQNLKNARELFDSYLQQVFSQKGEGWVDNKIGAICSFQNGFAFKSKDTVDASDTQLIRMGNLYQNILSLERKPAFYPNSYYDEHERYQLHTGDLIISLTGTVDKEDYGYTVEIPKTDRKLLLNQRIAKFINIDTTAINKRFLLRFLRSRGFLDKLYATARGTRQANLSTVTMSEMLISYPSLDQQDELIRVIDELEKNVFYLEDIYKKKLTSIDELKKSILRKAFSGELTATAK